MTKDPIMICAQNEIRSNNIEIDNTKLRASFVKDKLWPQFRDITVGFIGDGENNPISAADPALPDIDPLHIEIMDMFGQNPRVITVKEAIKK
jgi:hypothetical protein